MHRHWTSDETFLLIGFYRELKVLWDPNNPDYSSKLKRREAVSALAEKFCTTEIEINRKIHNLRCQFNGEVRKFHQKTDIHDVNVNQDCISTWEFFGVMKEMMQFPSDKRYRSHSKRVNNIFLKSSLSYQLMNYNFRFVFLQSISFDGHHTSVGSEIDHDEFMLRTIREYASDTSKVKKRKHNHDVNTTASDHVASSTDNDSHQSSVALDIRLNDEFQLYGDYVANELRSLKKENQRIAKLRITRILLELGESESSIRLDPYTGLTYPCPNRTMN